MVAEKLSLYLGKTHVKRLENKCVTEITSEQQLLAKCWETSQSNSESPVGGGWRILSGSTVEDSCSDREVERMARNSE